MLRKAIFWLHLVSGLAAGVLIAVMSFTGAALAFEKETIAWAERDARQVAAMPTGTPRLALENLLARIYAAQPDARIASINVQADERAAVTVVMPGNLSRYANPYTGEIREGVAPRTRAFMQTMKSWHTRLNFKPGPGNAGAAANSAANVVFVFLCLSGLVLWWPRAWNARTLRPSLWFVRRIRGKARDWNWHNTVGFWSLPALFIMAASGVVLSYRWAGDMVYRAVGEAPPVGNAPPRPVASNGGNAPAPPATSDTSTARPVQGPDDLLAVARREFPEADFVTLRFSPPLSAKPAAAAAAPATFNLVVRERNPWPPFATTTAVVDARTSKVLRTERLADFSTGFQLRRWIRLLHTGEALRWPGQLVAGLACLGCCLLVWTGFALAWRRFFPRDSSPPASPGSTTPAA